MKQFQSSVVSLALLCLTPSLLADAQNSSNAFVQGKLHYESGEYKLARAYFLRAIKEDPKNTRAQEFLRHVQAASKHGIKPTNLKARLNSITVRKVEFQDISVDQALAFLRVKVAESTSGQLKPNFILKGKTDAKVTLNLGEVPASEVLRYIAELSGHTLSYDPHAVVLTLQTEE